MNSIVVHVVLLLLLVAQTVFAQTTKNTQRADMVTRMAKIGRASSPTFSPDGTRLPSCPRYSRRDDLCTTVRLKPDTTYSDDVFTRVRLKPDTTYYYGLVTAEYGRRR